MIVNLFPSVWLYPTFHSCVKNDGSHCDIKYQPGMIPTPISVTPQKAGDFNISPMVPPLISAEPLLREEGQNSALCLTFLNIRSHGINQKKPSVPMTKKLYLQLKFVDR